MRGRFSPRVRLLLVAVLVAVTIPLLTMVETSYFLFLPGEASRLSGMITVEGGAPSPGTLLMTTVLAHQATPGLVVYGLFHPRVSVHHMSQIVPDGMDMDEYQRHTAELMSESQDLARFVALKQSGAEPVMEGAGVEISAIIPGGRWHVMSREMDLGFEAGDVIVEAGGAAVFTLEGFLSLVAGARDAGQADLDLRLTRGDAERVESMPLALLPETALAGGLLAWHAGLLLATASPVVTASVNIDIDAGDVGGPSAGLMFVLEIMGQLAGEDVTGGDLVAGTGAVTELGEVLPVGGVRQKVAAAEKTGAVLFLVPHWQESEARGAARTIQVVPVESVGGALSYLRGRQPATGGTLTPAAAGFYN